MTLELDRAWTVLNNEVIMRFMHWGMLFCSFHRMVKRTNIQEIELFRYSTRGQDSSPYFGYITSAPPDHMSSTGLGIQLEDALQYLVAGTFLVTGEGTSVQNVNLLFLQDR